MSALPFHSFTFQPLGALSPAGMSALIIPSAAPAPLKATNNRRTARSVFRTRGLMEPAAPQGVCTFGANSMAANTPDSLITGTLRPAVIASSAEGGSAYAYPAQ